jgi:predicted O-methyltransferase YrrM
MNIRLLKILFRPQRVPRYLYALCYALKKGILSFKIHFAGSTSLPQLVELHKLAENLPKGSIIVEIGCYGGLATAFLAVASKGKAMVYSIDPFDREVDKQKKYLAGSKDKAYLRGEMPMLFNKPSRKDVLRKIHSKKLRNVVLHEGYSDDFAEKWDRKIDLLWIDGDHNYLKVKKDFINWVRFLKKGGIIALDDANKKDKSVYWNMGLIGPTRVANDYVKAPNWINIKKIEAMVYATKNY